jgi:ABC-type multidrug transport system permease subunit
MSDTAASQTRGWSPAPLRELVLARLREFIREPEAIFWVYGFPILMSLALGVAFREKPVPQSVVAVRNDPGHEAVVAALQQRANEFKVEAVDAAEARLRLRKTQADLVVVPPSAPGGVYTYWFDATRAESLLAKERVDDQLQRANGRKDVLKSEVTPFSEPGGRYIDFLIPGLLGMGLMGGGLWGVGFVTVDMRIRKLLKRFLATPMRKSDFLLAVMISRFLFMIPEMAILLTFAYFAFGVVIHGHPLVVILLIAVGAFTFSGVGLLVASRARTIETVSGIMNLVMLPMWVLSGIFFSAERFPAAMQPFIQALPLTILNNALRAVINDGASLASQLTNLAVLAAWGLVTFFIALRIFRWQ